MATQDLFNRSMFQNQMGQQQVPQGTAIRPAPPQMQQQALQGQPQGGALKGQTRQGLTPQQIQQQMQQQALQGQPQQNMQQQALQGQQQGGALQGQTPQGLSPQQQQMQAQAMQQQIQQRMQQQGGALQGQQQQNMQQQGGVQRDNEMGLSPVPSSDGMAYAGGSEGWYNSDHLNYQGGSQKSIMPMPGPPPKIGDQWNFPQQTNQEPQPLDLANASQAAIMTKLKELQGMAKQNQGVGSLGPMQVSGSLSLNGGGNNAGGALQNSRQNQLQQGLGGLTSGQTRSGFSWDGVN